MANTYKLGDEDERELYMEFFKAMLDFGYTPFYIGNKLAYIVRAIEQAKEENNG